MVVHDRMQVLTLLVLLVEELQTIWISLQKIWRIIRSLNRLIRKKWTFSFRNRGTPQSLQSYDFFAKPSNFDDLGPKNKKYQGLKWILCPQKTYKKLYNCVVFKTEIVPCSRRREQRRILVLWTALKTFLPTRVLMKQIYYDLIEEKKHMDSRW